MSQHACIPVGSRGRRQGQPGPHIRGHGTWNRGGHHVRFYNAPLRTSLTRPRECLTDNTNRTSRAVKEILNNKKCVRSLPAHEFISPKERSTDAARGLRQLGSCSSAAAACAFPSRQAKHLRGALSSCLTRRSVPRPRILSSPRRPMVRRRLRSAIYVLRMDALGAHPSFLP